MTLIEGELVPRGDGWAVEIGGAAVPIPARPALQGDGAKRPVTLGIRPEDVAIGSGPLQASVKVVEPTGHETIVLLDLGSGTVTARAGNDIRLRPGEPVRLDFRSDKVHLFDTGTGARLNTEPTQSANNVRAVSGRA
jgi:multiple sugar transport system ATP-binding protein